RVLWRHRDGAAAITRPEVTDADVQAGRVSEARGALEIGSLFGAKFGGWELGCWSTSLRYRFSAALILASLPESINKKEVRGKSVEERPGLLFCLRRVPWQLDAFPRLRRRKMGQNDPLVQTCTGRSYKRIFSTVLVATRSVFCMLKVWAMSLSFHIESNCLRQVNKQIKKYQARYEISERAAIIKKGIELRSRSFSLNNQCVNVIEDAPPRSQKKPQGLREPTGAGEGGR
ncbi:unnamed protein product, partial [Cladocopium goreaui]